MAELPVEPAMAKCLLAGGEMGCSLVSPVSPALCAARSGVPSRQRHWPVGERQHSSNASGCLVALAARASWRLLRCAALTARAECAERTTTLLLPRAL